MKHLPSLLLITIISLIFSLANANANANADETIADQDNNQASSKLVSTSTLAIPVSRVAPRYPLAMARAGSEGWVQMSFVIAKDGSVIDPIIADSSGSRRFENAALKAVKQW